MTVINWGAVLCSSSKMQGAGPPIIVSSASLCTQKQSRETGAVLDGEDCPRTVVHEHGDILSRLKTFTVGIITSGWSQPRSLPTHGDSIWRQYFQQLKDHPYKDQHHPRHKGSEVLSNYLHKAVKPSQARSPPACSLSLHPYL